MLLVVCTIVAHSAPCKSMQWVLLCGGAVGSREGVTPPNPLRIQGKRVDMGELLRFCSQHDHRDTGCGYCLLDQWFRDCPSDYQQYLRQHFCSEVESDSQGAFFELVIFGLLGKLGYRVLPHPTTHVGTPDALATSTSGDSFYCESVVVDPEELRYNSREKKVMAELNKLECPNYLLAASDCGELRSNPPLAKMLRH